MNLKALLAQSLMISFSSVALMTPINSTADIINLGNKPTVLTQTNAPKRGMSMKKVLRKFGKPSKRYSAPGKVTAHNPKISKWSYGKTVIYFENKHVVHTVVHH